MFDTRLCVLTYCNLTVVKSPIVYLVDSSIASITGVGASNFWRCKDILPRFPRRTFMRQTFFLQNFCSSWYIIYRDFFSTRMVSLFVTMQYSNTEVNTARMHSQPGRQKNLKLSTTSQRAPNLESNTIPQCIIA